MVPCMTVSGLITKSAGMDATFGQMGVNTMDNGKRMICMELVSTFMRITFDTMVSLQTIRNKALGGTNGLMDASMRVGGTKGSSMASAHTMTTRREI